MIAEIIVEVSSSEVDRVFDYKIPEIYRGKNLIGYRVFVPFGPRRIEGYIIGQKENTNVDKTKLKEFYSLIDKSPTILPEMIELASFMKKKFHLKMVDCLRLFIPSQMRGEKIKPIYLKNYTLNKEFDFSGHDFSKAKKQLSAFLLCSPYYLPVFQSCSGSKPNVSFTA